MDDAKISQDTVAVLKLTVKDAATGAVLDAGTEPAAYLHGGYGNLLPKAEAALEGLAPGARLQLTLPVEDAFGPHEPKLVRTIAKKDFPPGVKVGGRLRGQTEDGELAIFTVQKIKGDQVFLDGNHPWVGKALALDIQVLSVRPATAEEITHRHAHGDHGHQHG